jgi:hypothetical protein
MTATGEVNSQPRDKRQAEGNGQPLGGSHVSSLPDSLSAGTWVRGKQS